MMTRLDDTLHLKGPRQEERHIACQTSRGSPTRKGILPELNGAQNGSNALPLSPPTVLENGADTIKSLESVPWNLEGIETIKENGVKLREWSLSSDSTGQDTHTLSEEEELSQLRDENKRLKGGLKEAAEVNSEWREYHQQRQQYVQRLVATIHELQHPRSAAQSPRQVLEVECGGEDEVRRLRTTVARLQADHDEHVTLLEMQVRAHRDDWEAERSEKQATQTGLAEAQARTALLLQELQLLQAKLADSESKRGVCWRCGAPRGETLQGGGSRTNGAVSRNASNPPSASHSTQASPVPAPSPAGSFGVSPTPLQDAPQVPLKGWIPVSMLHQIAFSGATPEHQSPVVQPSPRPTSLNTGRTPSPRTSTTPTPSLTPTPDTNGTDDKRRYESMGARPKVAVGAGKDVDGVGKVLGLVEEAVRGLDDAGTDGVGKVVGPVVEDERTAKHRARSILASAIPVSPVSAGPTPPFPSALVKSPSTPIMHKGYVPITSTVLTPINFRPPFVTHKRPSAMKQVALQTSSSSSHSHSPSHSRSGSSLASITAPSAPACTGAPHNTITPTTNSSSKSAAVNSSSKSTSVNSSRNGPDEKNNSVQQKAGGVSERVKEGRASKSGSSKGRGSVGGSRAGGGRGSSSGSQAVCTTTTTVTCSSPPTMAPTTTTTTSSSSDPAPAPHTVSSTPVKTGQSHVTPPNSRLSPIPQPLVTPQTSTCSSTTSNSMTAGKGSSKTVVKGSSKPEGECPGRGPRTQPVTSPPPTVTTSTATTAFASITVTTTAAGVHAPPSASTYSSTASSRSSSPGMSLTTFGLNSEGRGIPGAIFFAMGSDQRNSGRSPQPAPASRRDSTSSVGVKSPTPDSVLHKDSRPPSGVKSPPVSVNNSGDVATVKEEHWWSVEGSGRQSGGKLVNSTWVRLMGGQASTRPGSGLPWRTARAVSGQQLDQARRASHDDPSNGPATATFTCTPVVNSPASSTLSSAASSAASSPPPCPNSLPSHDLKSLASKNISSAIMSYELSSKCEGSTTPVANNDGVATFTRRDLVCPSCQMLFPPDKHVNFLDHFEACHGPEYADL